jgi:hypothetical protein
MDLVIKGAVVASIFRDVDHSLEASIEGRAEDPALRFGAAFQAILLQFQYRAERHNRLLIGVPHDRFLALDLNISLPKR